MSAAGLRGAYIKLAREFEAKAAHCPDGSQTRARHLHEAAKYHGFASRVNMNPRIEQEDM